MEKEAKERNQVLEICQIAMEAMGQTKNEALIMGKLPNKNAERGRIQKLWIF